MKYISVAEAATRWDISERSVRNYCAQGRIPNALLKGKIWYLPENAQKPERVNKRSINSRTLLEVLQSEKASKLPGGIYHKVQIDFTYNSNQMEGSRLTHDQTRYIFETNTIGVHETTLNVDDIVETSNHFRCIDLIIDRAGFIINEALIKQLHAMLKNGTSDSRKDWFAVGDYKKLPNEVGGKVTALPKEVPAKMKELVAAYNAKKERTLEELLDFHYRFECLHPFQDGNGRIGRLLLFKECLRNNIVPFIIDEELKMFYYRGLKEWQQERGFLRDTCLAAQDKFKANLDYFQIAYK